MVDQHSRLFNIIINNVRCTTLLFNLGSLPVPVQRGELEGDVQEHDVEEHDGEQHGEEVLLGRRRHLHI